MDFSAKILDWKLDILISYLLQYILQKCDVPTTKMSCKSFFRHFEIWISAETRRQMFFNGADCKKIGHLATE